MLKTCIYPGSFDPFTNGHFDILQRSAQYFNSVIVAVLNNSGKKCSFSVEERICMINNVIGNSGINAKAQSFAGLLVDFAQSNNAVAIIRGLRAVTDYEYELQLATMNKKLSPQIETLFLMADPKYAFVSSSLVKEVGRFGGDISEFVPAVNYKTVIERLENEHKNS